MEVSLRGSYGVQLQPVLRAGYPHHCVIPGLLASGVPIVPQFATIFMLRCDRIPVMLTCSRQLRFSGTCSALKSREAVRGWIPPKFVTCLYKEVRIKSSTHHFHGRFARLLLLSHS